MSLSAALKGTKNPLVAIPLLAVTMPDRVVARLALAECRPWRGRLASGVESRS
jgi:hypothetical protein